MPGLLDLFSLKTFGANPTDLTQWIQPVYDLSPHVIGGRAEFITVAPTPSNVGSGVSLANPLTIPIGEAWLVDHFGIFAQNAATKTGNWAIQVRDPNSTTGIGVGCTLAHVPPSTNAATGLIVPPTLYTPGTSFRLFQWTDDGAAWIPNPVTEIELRFIRLKA
jgi:hypothetical protein